MTPRTRKAAKPTTTPADNADTIRVAGHSRPFVRETVGAWLRAPDGAAEPVWSASQAEFCETFRISDQSARNWSERGMPVLKGADGRPRYGSEALRWATAWSVLRAVREKQRREMPAYLSMDDVARWELLEGDRPERVAIVPLDWSHPLRRAMLAIACAGIQPPPFDG